MCSVRLKVLDVLVNRGVVSILRRIEKAGSVTVVLLETGVQPRINDGQGMASAPKRLIDLGRKEFSEQP